MKLRGERGSSAGTASHRQSCEEGDRPKSALTDSFILARRLVSVSGVVSKSNQLLNSEEQRGVMVQCCEEGVYLPNRSP